MFAEESSHYSQQRERCITTPGLRVSAYEEYAYRGELTLLVETLGMSTWKFDIAEERAVLSMALYPSVALDPNYTSVTGICLPRRAYTTLTDQQA
jgi:hypothetical protein